MYGQYGHQAISATIATSASLSTAIPIAGFNKIALELPGTTALVNAAPTVYVQVCNAAAGSFRRLSVVNDSINTAASAVDWQILSTSGNRYVNVPGLAGYNYMKIECSVSATAAAGWLTVVHGIM
jgi:hypothetical protein